jgi:triosephosphate isomerase
MQASEHARRVFFVGGNWKCNPRSRVAVDELVKGLNEGPSTVPSETVVCVPAIYLDRVQSTLRKDFAVGAQNIYFEPAGAFTGEISAPMLVDLGVRWTIIGHSERRAIFGETDAVVAKKTSAALAERQLSVIGCLGETLQEFESGQTEQVIYRQLKAYADVLTNWDRFIIAYEPVWAIGTGKTATPERAQQVHSWLRNWLATNVNPNTARSVRILYGGSVTAANAEQLARQPDVDGFLVGGASLKPADFLTIVRAGGQKSNL